MKKIFTITVFMLAAVSFALAQEVQKPQYAVGEWCDYNDKFGKTIRRTVTEVRPDGGYTLVSEGEAFPKEEREYNADHRLVRLDQRVYTPFWGGPTFPLRPGLQGQFGPFTYSTTSGVTTATTSLKSASVESITVPAGTFTALVVRATVTYKRERGRENQFETSIWYSLDSSMKHALRQTFFDHGSKTNNWELSLIKCGGGNTVSSR